MINTFVLDISANSQPALFVHMRGRSSRVLNRPDNNIMNELIQVQTVIARSTMQWETYARVVHSEQLMVQNMHLAKVRIRCDFVTFRRVVIVVVRRIHRGEQRLQKIATEVGIRSES